MPDELLKWLNEHYHGIFLLIIGGVIAWLLAKVYFSFTSRIKKTEEDCKKIDGQIVPKLDSIGSAITSLSGSFNNLVVHLGAKDTTIDKKLFMSQSPLQLTPLGLQILDVLKGKEYIDKYVDYLIKEMDAIGVKTALDSQTIAPLVINKVSNEDKFTAIKNYLFTNPIFRTKGTDGEEISIPLDLSTVSNVLGIYLRDKYLAKHPELNPQDIPSV